MDQAKIGKFIQECRKKKNLTQAQLAEKLNITDRAVSKWENGRAMPDSSIMLALCRELGINVNDLLSGEVVEMENYNEKLENNLLDAVKQKEKADKQMLTLEVVFCIVSIAVMLVLCVVASYAEIDDWIRIVLIVAGLMPMLVFTPFAILIEQKAGYYECAKCHHKYIPAYARVFFSMHAGRTRYMKCPKCHQRSWNKKVINKD